MSKLKAWREREGLSRQDLADEFGVEPMTIFRWEQEPGSQHRRIPTESFLIKLWVRSRGEIDSNSFINYPDLDQKALPFDPPPVPPPAPLLEGAGDSQASAA